MKMKKIGFAVVALAFVFTSCKKDYTCACEAFDQVIDLQHGKMKKKEDAEEKCELAQKNYNEYDPNVTCTLK
jgi:hypothetical protein